MGLLDHVVILFLVFWETSILLSIMATPAYIPYQQCKKVPLFPLLSPASMICRHFNNGHSDWCEVVHHCSVICISLTISDVKYLYICSLAICMSSLEKYLFRSFTHFWLNLVLVIEMYILYICMFWKWSPCRLHHLQIFSPNA